MRSVLFWLAFPGAAIGQELPFEPAPLEACVNAAETMLDAEACIGMAAQACIDSPGGYTTAGMSMCYGQEAKYWDGRLNGAYNALMKNDKATDAEMEKSGLKVPSLAPALRDMKWAWIAYRDAACAYERTQWGGGTGQGPAVAQCVMELTADQALQLEARVQDRQNR